ncbi:MAG: LLM class flavin-dependent oxidoreductase [Solirubrobacterales bacterium]
MSIEIGIFHNAALDLPVAEDEKGITYFAADMDTTQEAAQRAVIDHIRQAILAEKLGYDAWYMSEHHFQPEGAEVSPAPLLVETAIAMRTNRIRLGQTANIIVWWNPLRLAEMTAMLDIISGGRAEVGLGRGYQSRETEILGRHYGASTQDQERNRASYEEIYEILIKAWTEKSFSYKGDNFAIPPAYTKWNHAQTKAYFNQPGGVGRDINQVLDLGPEVDDPNTPGVMAGSTLLKEISVLPQPFQKPHPQLWMPTTSERSVKWAAENGMNGSFMIESPERMKKAAEYYYKCAQEANFPDRQDRGEFKFGWDAEKRRGCSVLRYIHIDDNGIGNLEEATRGLQNQWSYYEPFGFGAFLNDPGQPLLPFNTKVTTELLREKKIVFFGSKEEVIEELLGLRETIGFDDWCLNVQFEFSGMESKRTEEQMQYFAEEVMPVLKKECGGGIDLPEVGDAQFEPTISVSA